MNVLIVDDDRAMLRTLRQLLRQLHFHSIEEATDGLMALNLLRRIPFDLVVSDWDMAPMSGIDLLRAVRRHEDFKHLPFVMVTAESKSENRLAARQAGVSDYIIKPFSAQALKTRLIRALGPF